MQISKLTYLYVYVKQITTIVQSNVLGHSKQSVIRVTYIMSSLKVILRMELYVYRNITTNILTCAYYFVKKCCDPEHLIFSNMLQLDFGRLQIKPLKKTDK